MLLTVKSNQKTLNRQIGYQFQGKRHILLTARDHEKRQGRDTVWELQAQELPEYIKANWLGIAWIVKVIIDTLTRKDNRSVRRHLLLTSVRTTPEALLRLIWQRLSIENEWHWARDAHWVSTPTATPTGSGASVRLLRTIVMNLLRRGVYRSIRQPASAGLRHQGNAGAGRGDNHRLSTLITLLGSPDAGSQ